MKPSSNTNLIEYKDRKVIELVACKYLQVVGLSIKETAYTFDASASGPRLLI